MNPQVWRVESINDGKGKIEPTPNRSEYRIALRRNYNIAVEQPKLNSGRIDWYEKIFGGHIVGLTSLFHRKIDRHSQSWSAALKNIILTSRLNQNDRAKCKNR